MRVSLSLKDIFKSPSTRIHSEPDSRPENHVQADQEMSQINKVLYERNVELAVRNRTLSVLRKIYNIISTTLGVEETAQRLIDEIVSELKFRKGFIALVNKERNILYTIATSTSDPRESAILTQFGNPFQNFSVELTQLENFCVNAVVTNRRRLTNILHDILVPLMDQESAEKLQDALNIQTSILYPITFADQILGVLVLEMDKHVGSLSQAERETLGELIEVVAIAIERTKVYADLKRANDQLKEADELKDEFVYVASHELRTPMTAIKNYLWLALNRYGKELDPKMKQSLVRAYISTERLITLVQDMLTVSRIEGKRLVLNFEEIDLMELYEQLFEEINVTAQKERIVMTLVPADKKYIVYGDRTRIGEVLQNLLSNAIKFTPRGGRVTVSVRESGSMIATDVSDTGFGIPTGDLPRLFKKFGRLGHSYKKVAESAGTGLGLFISKQIIEAHHGSITVVSEEDRGSTFIFTLPLKQVIAPAVPVDSPTPTV
ncbi:GAF domain-containing sensor histidine kinase [Candidatus Roizmanbacteria bacterium]|nr:GAF domain-containing sensor histidine kinase [Candidatus Roizmanbacteria bacterium]